MAKLALCTCMVNLGGDLRQVVHRGETRPVTWPEAEVLMHIHGESSVTDITVFDFVERTVPDEFERLTLKYGKAPVATLFPGKRPAMEFEPSAAIKRSPEIMAAQAPTRGKPRKSRAKPAAAEPEPAEETPEIFGHTETEASVLE